jgi:hypothetical protein
MGDPKSICQDVTTLPERRVLESRRCPLYPTCMFDRECDVPCPFAILPNGPRTPFMDDSSGQHYAANKWRVADNVALRDIMPDLNGRSFTSCPRLLYGMTGDVVVLPHNIRSRRIDLFLKGQFRSLVSFRLICAMAAPIWCLYECQIDKPCFHCTPCRHWDRDDAAQPGLVTVEHVRRWRVGQLPFYTMNG